MTHEMNLCDLAELAPEWTPHAALQCAGARPVSKSSLTTIQNRTIPVPILRQLGESGFAPVLIARRIGSISALISTIRSAGSGTDGSSSDAYRHPTAYDGTTVNPAVMDATVVDANTTDTNTTATAVGKGVS